MNDAPKRSRTRRSRKAQPAPFITELELARLGGGEVAYIKRMSAEEARRLFPQVQGLPRGIEVFSVHAADGTPLAITDTRSAAIDHAHNDKLAVATVH